MSQMGGSDRTRGDVLTEKRLRTLADADRRAVLRYFWATGDDTATLEALSDYVATFERTSDRERLPTVLHHMALPMLADAGFIDYDPDTHFVRYCGEAACDAVRDVVGDITVTV